VAQLVRGLSVEEALAQCALLPKRAARVTEKVLLSARANATHNHGLAPLSLRVARAFVGKGTYLRRIKWHARGKSGMMHHPKAHLTVVLEEAAPSTGSGPGVGGGRISRRVARDAAPAGGAPAAWQRHQHKRMEKRARDAALGGSPAAGPAAGRLAAARQARTAAA
jgi:ribosomal protein L22